MADPKLRYELVVDDKGTASIKSFNSSLDTAGRKASTVSGKIGGIAGKAAKLAGKLTAVGAAGAAAFAGWGIKKAIGQFATFETQLAKLKNLGVDSLGAIKDQIMALPSELGSATEMVAGYYQVLSAGIKKGKNAIDVLVTSAKLAKAAHLDQATAVKAVTSGMKAFDTSAKETANSLMKIEQTGMTEVRLLANYFGEIAGQADAMNLKLEETSSALAAVSQMSGTTEKGATQLRALFRELISPTDELNELFKDMGGTMRAIEQVGLAGVLERIEKATGGSAVKIEKLFGSAEAAAAATSLLSKNMQYFNDALDAQKNKAGALEETWNTFKDTLNAIWDTFKNTVGRIAIEIGEDLAPTVKNLVTQTSEWLKVNKELITVKISDWLSGITQWIDKIDLSKLDFAVVAEKGDKLINALSTMAKDIGTVAEAAGKLLGVLDKAIKKANSWAEKMGFAWKIISRDYQGLVQDVMAGSDKIAGKHAETAATVKKNPIEVTADTSDAEAEVGRLKDKTQDLDAKANVTADTSDAEAEVYQFKNKTEDLLAEANVTADTTAGKKKVEELVYYVEGERRVLTVDADTSAAEEKLSSLEKWIKSVGEQAGGTIDKFGRLNKETDKVADSVNSVGDAAEKMGSSAKKGAEETEGHLKDLKKPINAIGGWYDDVKHKVEGEPINPEVDNSQAKQAEEEVQAEAENTRRSVTKIMDVNVNIDPAISALEKLKQQHAGVMAQLQHDYALAVSQASQISPWAEYNTRQSGQEAMNKMSGWFSNAERGIQQRLWAKQAGGGDFSKEDKEKLSDMGFEGGNRLSDFFSFQTGTGLVGLPRTGAFEGHKGEIVLNPDQSRALREGSSLVRERNEIKPAVSAGSLGGGKGQTNGSAGSIMGGGDINVTVAPTFMSGDAFAARAVAREIRQALDEDERRKN